MKKLVQTLAEIIRSHVGNSIREQSGDKLEARFVFHGPPLEILGQVFDELAQGGGIEVIYGPDHAKTTIPVLLPLPPGQAPTLNPNIGESGKCNESHLLHVRNDPYLASFLALMPPGRHSNQSGETTQEDFGINAKNSGNASIAPWWEDGFVQDLIENGLKSAGFSIDDLDGPKQLLKRAASAFEDVSPGTGPWHLLSRLYSISDDPQGLPIGSALALACGMPPLPSGGVSPKIQLEILEKIADEMSNGFKTTIDRLKEKATLEPVKQALSSFLSHIQAKCEIQTNFEQSTPAFYLPSDSLALTAPPSWWKVLDSDCWSDLLEEDPDVGELAIACTNPIYPISKKGMPAIVRSDIWLSISAESSEDGTLESILLTGGSAGKIGVTIPVANGEELTYHDTLPASGQRSATSFKAIASYTTRGNSGVQKTATTKVVSLATWGPGIIVTSRMATKISLPKKPRKGNTHANWETEISVPGPGRYELLVLASPNVVVTKAEGVLDDALEQASEIPQDLVLHKTKDGDCQVEIEAEGNYQLSISFLSASGQVENCKVFITCEEAKEEGCRSEFERLIKLNRRHLERFDAKAVVQLDRHARTSSLQAWILDEQNSAKSFIPLVMSDDYATQWASPDWETASGPILSGALFLHDPRPSASLFNPPPGFIDARKEIANRVRQTSDQAGLLESAPLGKWLANDPEFRALVEKYLDAYTAWLGSDREIASWADVIAVCPRVADGRTLSSEPDAIILSPLHPLRLAWHCLAQGVLHDAVEGKSPLPCPAASVLDPDCVPDLLVLPLQTPAGADGIKKIPFLSVECNSDYWSVLWNGSRLSQIADKSRKPPFDNAFGLVIGGIASGFSPAQVSRALDDVSELLSAKPIISLAISSGGGATDACNEGLATWCTKHFGNGDTPSPRQGVGQRVLEVYDSRPKESHPDEAMIANLSEDTSNHVRWFTEQPWGVKPDLGIIAQLDSAEPTATTLEHRSPLGIGGLIRHRVRRQLHGAFLSESRQALPMPPSGNVFADKVAYCIGVLEGSLDDKIGLQFSPNVHAVASMLEEKKAGFVAVSSSAVDPACFLGGWIQGTYLWDYDLPSYSHRAGDTSGYYLLSPVRDADRDALGRVLRPLPGCSLLDDAKLEEILIEVARRGIPTVRGLSSDDSGATGDLGLFLAVRLLQDQFRLSGNMESLLPVLAGTPDNASIALIIPVDPFRGYLADLARSLGKDRKDISLSRPDLLVVGIRIEGGKTWMHLTPVEVKCRHQGSAFSPGEAKEALGQARALSSLFTDLGENSSKSLAWRLAYQHLLLSMIGFGLRVYSPHEVIKEQAGRWAGYHERITATILSPDWDGMSIDKYGRLIVIDGSPASKPSDHDGDGFQESIYISPQDAGQIVGGDAQVFYSYVRAKLGDWRFFPSPHAQEWHADNTDGSSPLDPVLDGGGNGEQPLAATGEERGETLKNEPPQPSLPTKEEPTPLGSETGIILSVGKTVDGFEPRPLSLNISDTKLNHLNIGVVGDLGTGKTQLLKSLIFQIATGSLGNRGIKPRFLIFDYKRDYSSQDFVEATGARVVRPVHMPLNLFDTSSLGDSVAPWLDRFRFFADVLDKVYSGIGPVQRDKLKGAVRAAYENCALQGRQPTIYDIHAEYRNLLGGKSDSPMAIIDDLVDMEVFEKDPTKTRSFDDFLDGVVVISLDAMGQDDRSKNMLVAIMLNMFYENMLKTPKRPFLGTAPQLRVIDSYLLVDEADNIMRYEFDVLRKLLLQGREFGAGIILASQYLRHFKGGTTDYREPLLTWFIHKVPNATPAELGALGFTADLGELSERVKALPNHHCLYKTVDVSGEAIKGLPFYELLENMQR